MFFFLLSMFMSLFICSCFSQLSQSTPGALGDAFTANKSARPYTTFELDQIRQHAKRYVII